MKEEHNPIMHDTVMVAERKERVLRYLSIFPLFNYGMLPQTWEDSEDLDPRTKLKVRERAECRAMTTL
jgi:hypothetical protein